MKFKWLVLPVFIFAGAFLVFSSMSRAGDTALTEAGIKAFYKKAVDVQMSGVKPTMDFYKKHTHEESKTVVHVITNMAGAPQQKQTLTMNKRELLHETQKGYEMMLLESLENNILSMKIDADGRSAKVKDSTYSVAIMSMNAGQGIVKFRVEQSMLCDSIIVINGDNVIQTKESVCSVEANTKSVD